MVFPLLILACDALIAFDSISANQPYNVNSNLIYQDDRKRDYRNFKLIRIHPRNKETLAYLKHLYQSNSPYELDFWQPPSQIDALVDVTVSPEDAQIFVHDLESKKIEYIVAISDLQQAIESERSGIREESFSDDSLHLNKYNRLSDIEEHLKKLKDEYPEMVTLIEIGKSHENRSITVVKLSGKRSFGTNVSIWIDGGIHAREWITPAVALIIIDELIHGYAREAVVQNIMDSIDWYILPIMNPDGYEYTHTKNRMWRKNRRPAQCKRNYFHTVCCIGVDLNRNFDWFWASSGSSTDPCHETYHGPEAFSEPETKAVKDFLEINPPKAFLTLHAYSQMWLIPYGHRKRSYPQDYSTALKPLALRATKALQKVHGTRYAVGTGADLMYEASGASHDWAKGYLHIPYTYLIELRPKNTMFGNGFLLPEREIQPTAEETWEAIKVVADELLGQFAQPQIREMLLNRTSTGTPTVAETTTKIRPKGAEILLRSKPSESIETTTKFMTSANTTVTIQESRVSIMQMTPTTTSIAPTASTTKVLETTDEITNKQITPENLTTSTDTKAIRTSTTTSTSITLPNTIATITTSTLTTIIATTTNTTITTTTPTTTTTTTITATPVTTTTTTASASKTMTRKSAETTTKTIITVPITTTTELTTTTTKQTATTVLPKTMGTTTTLTFITQPTTTTTELRTTTKATERMTTTVATITWPIPFTIPSTEDFTHIPVTISVVNSTSTTVRCIDYGVYCKWWRIHDLCRLQRVQLLCAFSCHITCSRKTSNHRR